MTVNFIYNAASYERRRRCENNAYQLKSKIVVSADKYKQKPHQGNQSELMRIHLTVSSFVEK